VEEVAVVAGTQIIEPDEWNKLTNAQRDESEPIMVNKLMERETKCVVSELESRLTSLENSNSEDQEEDDLQYNATTRWKPRLMDG
jgi:hypothetical protein